MRSYNSYTAGSASLALSTVVKVTCSIDGGACCRQCVICFPMCLEAGVSGAASCVHTVCRVSPHSRRASFVPVLPHMCVGVHGTVC